MTVRANCGVHGQYKRVVGRFNVPPALGGLIARHKLMPDEKISPFKKGVNFQGSEWVAENLWLLERKRMVLCYYTMSSVRSFRQWVG